MVDPLARARKIHEAESANSDPLPADTPDALLFEHNTYAALLDVIEKAFTKSELFGDWGFRTRNGVFMEALPGVRRALVNLEARIEEETYE